MDNININNIYQKCLNGTVTSGERQQLLKWLKSPGNEVAAKDLLLLAIHENSADADINDLNTEGIVQAILWADKQEAPFSTADLEFADRNFPPASDFKIAFHRVHFLKTTWFRYAVAIILVFGIGTAVVVSLTGNKKNNQAVWKQPTLKPQDIQPGRQGAILTLADGKQLVLDSLGDGIISDQSGAQAVLNNGQLTYNVTGNSNDKIVYNTMSTPKGRQFHVTLPDGTVVWLNAATSISYPTVFKGNERRVKIKGEAYFEVAKNATMPFHVNVNNKADIEVLGTHFNVDAYDNNNNKINTTLLEGSVKMNGTIIKPGQQAQITNAVQIINNVDISKVMAWKNGLFNFEGATLDEVMKQLERWYDIEVVYEKGIPNIEFGGEMTKNISLSGLLLVLEKSDIHFRLEGRKLIVMP